MFDPHSALKLLTYSRQSALRRSSAGASSVESFQPGIIIGDKGPASTSSYDRA